MKIIRFSKFFLASAIFSAVLIVAGIVGYIALGFNLGIDFQAGLIEEVQFARPAFSVTYSGRGVAGISLDREGIAVTVSGSGVGGRYVFSYAEYGAVAGIARALGGAVEGLDVSLAGNGNEPTAGIVYNAQGNPQLGSEPYVVHVLPPDGPAISIQDVRDALSGFERTVSVQQLGVPSDRHYMIRLESSGAEGEGGVPADSITAALESRFGRGEVVVIRSDFVGSRFSKDLTDQAGILLFFTLVLILAYSSVRFKPQYAIGAVLAIVHDGLVIVGFVVWTRMEFNTTTIAAILTILGYSINDTIVIFDRIRETRRIYPEDSFLDILDRSLTETLGRTIITTLTTLLAVVSLYIFTRGSMQDFALTLIVGMVSGVYSTIFIASGFVNFWEVRKNRREKKRLAGTPSAARA
ncbi:MAG: protein translocase subunit SecF [Treponema sp.]|jgi:preprotein translocase subunit SecF|nr:protein translocase subunit SecF [Treponema sp.]